MTPPIRRWISDRCRGSLSRQPKLCFSPNVRAFRLWNHPPQPRSRRSGRDKYLVYGAPCFDDASIDEVVDSLRSGSLGTAPKVARLEAMVREYTGAVHTVAVNSCTAALYLSLLAADVGPGDEVITTPMTSCGMADSIIQAGARPVFVDCERDTQLIDVTRIAAAITPRTKAIVPVHFAGRVCDMNAIGEIARRHGLRVIEDATQSIEGRYAGNKVGTMSDLACFSFCVTKNVTTGKSGMVATADPDH
ncbi:MAG: DegT/DnrJ/EryC1/StrS aminotransferase family protein [Gemmatimonadales bacterium]